MKGKYLFIGILILLGSCNNQISVEDCSTYDYGDCETKKYDDAYIDISFTINSEYKKVPYELYEGTVDKGKLVLQDTAVENSLRILGDFNQQYSAKAIYKKNDKSISVIDGEKTKRWSQNVCDSTCWHYKDIKLDLKLKTSI